MASQKNSGTKPGADKAAADKAAADKAAADKAAADKAAADKAAADKEKLKDGVFVRSVPESFRRCGYSFNRDGVGIALDLLTEDDLGILESEPNLIVERVQFPMAEQD